MTDIRPGTDLEFERLKLIQRRALAEPWPELLESAVGGYPPVYVAFDHRPVGYAVIISGPDGVAYLPELAVDPDRHREGFGSALVQFVCTELHGDGYRELRLSVLAADEGAREFYANCGFETVEYLPDEFDSGDGVLLRKPLGPASDM